MDSLRIQTTLENMCVKQMNDGLNGQNGAVSVASPEGEAVCLSPVYFDLHEQHIIQEHSKGKRCDS